MKIMDGCSSLRSFLDGEHPALLRHGPKTTDVSRVSIKHSPSLTIHRVLLMRGLSMILDNECLPELRPSLIVHTYVSLARSTKAATSNQCLGQM